MRDIERLFREMNRMMQAGPRGHRIAETTPYDPRQYEGYRREVVDGEVTEYYLEDGDWKKVGETDSSYEVTDDSFTIDLSGEIPDGVNVADASLNNGVLSVTFEAETGDSDEE